MRNLFILNALIFVVVTSAVEGQSIMPFNPK